MKIEIYIDALIGQPHNSVIVVSIAVQRPSLASLATFYCHSDTLQFNFNGTVTSTSRQRQSIVRHCTFD